MLSLYIHIPFCNHKCKYCSFFVVPENDDALKAGGMEVMKEKYLASLLLENAARSQQYSNQQIKTIYIGGGTPFQLGQDNLFTLIDTVLETRDCEFLEELSIELNPDPFDEVITFISLAQKKYKDIFRLRFSFGIQTFDDKILQASKRNYIYNNIIHRLREVIEIKENNTCYNLDFIAFGQHPGVLPQPTSETEANPSRLPRDKVRRDFFDKVLKSQAFDGLSIYTLELFPGAEWYYDIKEKTQQGAILSDDETIWKEFQRLKKAAMDAGYHRYEISNFALRGKRSLHNMVYWNMENYLGLGINASSCVKLPLTPPVGEGETSSVATRWKNTTHWKDYLSGSWFDQESSIPLSEKELMSEEVMLRLRTDQGIVLETYRDVLVQDIDQVLQDLVASKHLIFESDTGLIKLTSKGLDVYNSVLLEVLEAL